MPIHLYQERGTSLDVLKDDDWDLPSQLEKLEKWVHANRDQLNDGPYIADIGFMIRSDASGGGAVLSSDVMKLFAEIGLSLYFSEYVGYSG